MASTFVHCPGCNARQYLTTSKSPLMAAHRAWVIEHRPLCNDCVALEAYEAALAQAVDLELPVLQGTDAQLQLGERVRVPALVNLMLRVERPVSTYTPQTAEQIVEYGRRQDALLWLTNQTNATWWCEHQTDTDAQLVNAAIEEVEAARRPASDRALIEAVRAESLILPKKKAVATAAIRLHNGVEIVAPGDLPAIRNVMHVLGFEWAYKAKRWVQTDVGVPVAVAAGEALLEAGLSVRVLDNDVRKRIKSRQP